MSELTVNVGAIQNTFEGSKEKTIEKVGDLIAESVKEGKLDYLVTEEFFALNFFPTTKNDEFFGLAETIPGYTTDSMSEIAKKNNVSVLTSVYKKTESGVYYNTLIFIDRKGNIAGKYRKNHIPYVDFGDVTSLEKIYYAEGNLGFPVFKAEIFNFGMLICYDRNFPETWRCLTLGGAQVVFASISSFGWRQEYFTFELRTHAYENSIFVVASNRTGDEGKSHFFGSSLIIDPFGDIVKQASENRDEIVRATIDLGQVDQARIRFPYYRDRRPNIYSAILNKPD